MIERFECNAYIWNSLIHSIFLMLLIILIFLNMINFLNGKASLNDSNVLFCVLQYLNTSTPIQLSWHSGKYQTLV